MPWMRSLLLGSSIYTSPIIRTLQLPLTNHTLSNILTLPHLPVQFTYLADNLLHNPIKST
jgi:hypothetical protein